MAKKTNIEVRISPPSIGALHVTIVGISPLLMNKPPADLFNALDGGKDVKLTHAEMAEKKVYYLDAKKKTYGAPAIWFQVALVNAVRQLNDKKILTLVSAKGAFAVLSDKSKSMCKLVTDGWEVSSMVGWNGKKPNPAVRPEFAVWSTKIIVKYNEALLTGDDMGSLLALTGLTIGVGAYRPNCSGTYGMFEIARK